MGLIMRRQSEAYPGGGGGLSGGGGLGGGGGLQLGQCIRHESKFSAVGTASAKAAVSTVSMKCSNWSSFRRPHAHRHYHIGCGKQMPVGPMQCSAVSTLEEVALAVVDCT